MTQEEIERLASEWLIENVNNQTSEKIAFIDGFNKAKKYYSKDYARQVAIQVRQECADKVRLTWSKTKNGKRNRDLEIDKESILSINIEQFLK